MSIDFIFLGTAFVLMGILLVLAMVLYGQIYGEHQPVGRHRPEYLDALEKEYYEGYKDALANDTAVVNSYNAIIKRMKEERPKYSLGQVSGETQIIKFPNPITQTEADEIVKNGFGVKQEQIDEARASQGSFYAPSHRQPDQFDDFNKRIAVPKMSTDRPRAVGEQLARIALPVQRPKLEDTNVLVKEQENSNV